MRPLLLLCVCLVCLACLDTAEASRVRRKRSHQTQIDTGSVPNSHRKRPAPSSEESPNKKPRTESGTAVDTVIPEEFDLRTSRFRPCIHPSSIEQGECDNCYAHSVSSSVSDRYCISLYRSNLLAGEPIPTTALSDTLLSPQDLTSCGGGEGCQGEGAEGNSVLVAYNHVHRYGIVSDACMPYVSGTGIAGECQRLCANGSPKKKIRIGGVEQFGYKLRRQGTGIIMSDIIQNGPVTAGMRYYGTEFHGFFDVKANKDQVYIPNGGSFPPKQSGAHAVKIIGWGSQTQIHKGEAVNVPYWLCQNTWGETKKPAYFKIVRELDFFKNEGDFFQHSVGMESSVYGAKAPFTTALDYSGAVGKTPPSPWEPAGAVRKYHSLMKKLYRFGYDGQPGGH